MKVTWYLHIPAGAAVGCSAIKRLLWVHSLNGTFEFLLSYCVQFHVVFDRDIWRVYSNKLLIKWAMILGICPHIKPLSRCHNSPIIVWMYLQGLSLHKIMHTWCMRKISHTFNFCRTEFIWESIRNLFSFAVINLTHKTGTDVFTLLIISWLLMT